MKKTFIILAFLFTGMVTLKAQYANLVIFTEDSHPFTLIVNGQQQNEFPETNIKVTDLPAPSYKVKIIFDDPNLKPINKTIYLRPGMESTYCVKYIKKGLTLRFMNEFPAEDQYEMVAGQMVTGFLPQGFVPGQQHQQAQTQTTTTIINNTTVNNNINVSAEGVGNNVTLVNKNEETGGMNTGVTNGTQTGQTGYQGQPGETGQPGMPPHGYDPLPGYEGPFGCYNAIRPQEFESIKYSISEKSFEDTKLTIAKQIVMSKCILSFQVREIMLLFSFEDTRLQFAKFAYAYTYDIGNYYKVNDAFTFESSIEELNRFIMHSTDN